MEFQERPGNVRDDRPYLQQLLDAAGKAPGTHLVIPPGTYVLSSPIARSTMENAISGVYGENPEPVMFTPAFPYTVGLSLAGHRGTVVDARGVCLMVDGFMEVLELVDCRNVTVRGLTIDYLRKPYSKGRIESYLHTGRHSGRMTVRFGEAYPVTEMTIMPRYCAYDERTRRFSQDLVVGERRWLGNQTFEMELTSMPDTDMTGQEFYVWHSFHFRPAILVEEAADICLEDVTIHAQPGMGIVGHRSENITMQRLRVCPSPGEHMSTNTDATHFTSCRGQLCFEACSFEGHGDDATNVHTFYHDIELLSGNRVRGRVTVPTHSLTLDWPDAGDTMELVDRKSLALRQTYRVLSVRPYPELGYYEATLDQALPEDAEQNMYLSDVSRCPEVLFRHCVCHNHWARSVLLKTRHACVDSCFFSGSFLQAVHVAPEASWHEGVSCQDIRIENNRFVDCGLTGHAEVGGIRVEVSAPSPEGTLQKGIIIRNNTFELPGVRYAVSIRNTADVILENNAFLHGTADIEIKDCVHVVSDLPALCGT